MGYRILKNVFFQHTVNIYPSFSGKPREIVNTYTEAIKTIDPKLATGKLSKLWIEFAGFYEKNEQLAEARVIFEKAVLVPFVKVFSAGYILVFYRKDLNYNYIKNLLEPPYFPSLSMNYDPINEFTHLNIPT